MMSTETEIQKSLREIITWLTGQRHIQYLDLKKILLPFGYFPSVLIAELNEKSIELFDENVLDDEQNQIVVHQVFLSKLLPKLNDIDSLSDILDIKLNQQSNSIDAASTLVESSTNASLMRSINANSALTEDTYEEALNYYVPYGKYPQNEKEALRLFKKAGNLGCLDAFIDIAEIYKDGGVFNRSSKTQQSYDKAIEYYSMGARKGNVFCYLKMGELYAADLLDAKNASKCFSLFHQKFRELEVNRNLVFSDENIQTSAGLIASELHQNSRGTYSNPIDPIYKNLTVYHRAVIGLAPLVADLFISHFEKKMAIEGTNSHTSSLIDAFKNYLHENS